MLSYNDVVRNYKGKVVEMTSFLDNGKWTVDWERLEFYGIGFVSLTEITRYSPELPVEKLIKVEPTNAFPFVFDTGVSRFMYITDIKEKSVSREMMTHGELMEWLAKGNGIVRIGNETLVRTSIKLDELEFYWEIPSGKYLIKGFDEKEWHEPFRGVM